MNENKEDLTTILYDYFNFLGMEDKLETHKILITIKLFLVRLKTLNVKCCFPPQTTANSAFEIEEFIKKNHETALKLEYPKTINATNLNSIAVQTFREHYLNTMLENFELTKQYNISLILPKAISTQEEEAQQKQSKSIKHTKMKEDLDI